MAEQLRTEAGGVSPDDFRRAGHALVDILAEFFEGIEGMPVTPNPDAATVRALLPQGSLPDRSRDVPQLLEETARTLIRNSLHNGHPRFWAYITSSANPAGVLADMIASAMNPNSALWSLAPVSTEMELQAIRWIAELIGYPPDCGGILVSGGNMANFVCMLAARRAKAPWPIHETGPHDGPKLVAYVSAEAHTWVDKASDLFGLGSRQVRWIEVDEARRMRPDRLREAVAADRATGRLPFMVVGTAGTVATGAVDPLDALADVCETEDLWYHIDGAYGAFAAALPDAPAEMRAFHRADSVAVDPHKWLYAPLEAGCALVKRVADLERAFSHKPSYLDVDGSETDNLVMFVERGPQNSRGFRALKVWLGLQSFGREGIVRLISEDIALSRHMADRLRAHPNIEVTSQNLSIATFRYVPDDVDAAQDSAYLNRLNELILERLQASGAAFPSQARIGDSFVLRCCIVNFRTTAKDVEALPGLVAELGEQAHKDLLTQVANDQ